MVRELAGNDPERMRAVIRWPVREALLAYVALMQDASMEAYRWNTLIWWARAPNVKKPGRPPSVPPILRKG